MENRAEADQFIDLEYEKEQQDATEWVGDGHFVNRNWLLQDGETTDEVDVETTRPLILHTGARLTASEESFAHEQHPFVAFVHLLKHADKNSVVFISMPFLTDFMVINELCHYADPAVAGLHINILLGPKSWVTESFERFVGENAAREQAVARLHIKRYGRDEDDSKSKYSHSKIMVATSGIMIGSYNYTYASRFRHTEHAVLLGADHDSSGILAELDDLWTNKAGPEILIKKKAKPVYDKVNPYKRLKTKES
mmetsp:Transcript_15208/g.21996  ORF Transcript_15208/g.21996 Transcript_15208/m.21996 type:complete len:253 (-) Transcript_15208:23-781(-)|eukprot:CAMPEP_0202467614 /NCGR_PEP_ID=MMETSP1360-20130828/72736_1 /ASSEMBLY_ACC=CAM_ASM_000848 /TAXON_ID=515479 /ORGANISM="Licmophora paradoxa, Strain CCMP2313" /LENGTH=252 /DNA_ID=CAMNT_0049092239 /DNA_START=38 /DNA_END=796 /DNA_ORIENTATION=+